MQSTITLNNGVELPRVGLGTFRSQGADVKAAVKAAVAHGITHIDTASIYKNEEQIAEALREARVPRESVFITSKLSPYEMGGDKAPAAIAAILQRLDTSYVDLLLIHWPAVARTDPTSPANAEARAATWRALEEAQRAGAARAIGVSNFEASHLQQLLAQASVRPAANQFEVHPRQPCIALRRLCAEEGVAVVAYASLGCGDLLTHPLVAELAGSCGKTPAQVLLRWGLQQGCAVIPKSIREERIAQAAPGDLLTWQLSPDQMARLDALADGHKYCWDASKVV